MPDDMASEFGEYVGLAGDNTRGSRNAYGKPGKRRTFEEMFGPVPETLEEFLEGFNNA